MTKVDDVFADLDPGTSFFGLDWKYDDDDDDNDDDDDDDDDDDVDDDDDDLSK